MVSQTEFNKMVILVLGDPRFTGDLKQAQTIVKETYC